MTFCVYHKPSNSVYTSVAEINGRWIDGVTGHDVTGFQLLGEYLGSKWTWQDGRYEYYRNGNDVYQFTPDQRYIWLCRAECIKAYQKIWGKLIKSEKIECAT